MGFSLNNLGDTLLKIGKNTLQTGTFYAAAKTLNSPCNRGLSIFGCGTFSPCMPMGIMGGYTLGYPGMGGMGLGAYAYGANMALMTPYAQMAIGQACGQAAALADQLKAQSGGRFTIPGYQTPVLQMMQQQQQQIEPTNNEAAEKFSSHNTELGEQFEEHTKTGATTQFVMSDWEGKAAGEEKDKEYTQYASNFAKSYIANMDKKVGNEDNEITEEEFTKYNMASDLDENATEAEKAQNKTLSQIAFKKIDQNGDGKIDWKEMAATLSVYDSMSGSRDGKITNEELAAGGSELVNSASTTMDQKLRSEYTRLFGKTEAKEE